MEAVAAGDEIAGDFNKRILVMEADLRLRRVEVVHRGVLDLEEDLSTRGEPRRDQILDPLVLRIDHDRAPAGELGEVDAMRAAAEPKVDAFVNEPFAIHAAADAGLPQQLDRAVLEHAGADGGLDLLAAPPPAHHPSEGVGMERWRG